MSGQPRFTYDDQKLSDEENGKGKLPITQGYFPSQTGRSDYNNVGVTVGTGVDLGRKDEQYFRRINVSQVTINKLKPFMGLRGEEAEKKARELKLTQEEANELSRCVQNDFKIQLEKEVERAYPGKMEGLSVSERTLLYSRRYQYGHVDPELLRAVIERDEEAVVRFLEKDKLYKNRTNGQIADYQKDQRDQQEARRVSSLTSSFNWTTKYTSPPAKIQALEDYKITNQFREYRNSTVFEKAINEQRGTLFSDKAFSFDRPSSFKDYTSSSEKPSLLRDYTSSSSSSFGSLGASNKFSFNSGFSFKF